MRRVKTIEYSLKYAGVITLLMEGNDKRKKLGKKNIKKVTKNK